MSRLITDMTVRRIFQGLLLLVLAGLTATAVLSCIILIARMVSSAPISSAQIPTVLTILALPLSDAFGQSVAMLIAVFPIVLSAVCFVPDTSGTEPRAGADLNRVGHAALVILLVSATGWLILLGIFNIKPDLVDEFKKDDTQIALAKGTIGGVLAFHGNYLAVLLGVTAGQKPRKAIP